MNYIIRFTLSTTFKDHFIVGETEGDCVLAAQSEATSLKGRIMSCATYKLFTTLK